MTKQIKPLISHYNSAELIRKICIALEKSNVNLSKLTNSDLAPVDQFHVRGEAASKEMFENIDVTGRDILDVGCGIGGLSRFLAADKKGRITGIDLNPTYIKTAKLLTELCGLQDKITFLEADATNLPFEKAVFDVVSTQHVQMNIPNKTAFYGEIKRVLKSKGTFVYYDIFKKGENKIHFPVPWAPDESISFLSTKDEVHDILDILGFIELDVKDQTAAGILFLEKLLAKMKKKDIPPLGLHLLMGVDARVKIENLLKGLVNENLEIEAGTFTLN